MLIVLQGLERGLFQNWQHSPLHRQHRKLKVDQSPKALDFPLQVEIHFWALLRQVILEKANGIAWEALAHQPRDLNNRKPQVKQTIVIIVVAFSHMRFFVKKNVTWRMFTLRKWGVELGSGGGTIGSHCFACMDWMWRHWGHEVCCFPKWLTRKKREKTFCSLLLVERRWGDGRIPQQASHVRSY